jgi:hypothetical protein
LALEKYYEELKLLKAISSISQKIKTHAVIVNGSKAFGFSTVYNHYFMTF